MKNPFEKIFNKQEIKTSPETENGPRYDHDWPTSQFLGRAGEKDLFFDPQDNGILIVKSGNGSENMETEMISSPEAQESILALPDNDPFKIALQKFYNEHDVEPGSELNISPNDNE
jgi:hypothetical protein